MIASLAELRTENPQVYQQYLAVETMWEGRAAEWKAKYEASQARIRELEAALGAGPADEALPIADKLAQQILDPQGVQFDSWVDPDDTDADEQ
jgi:hypothetical protein